MTPKRSIGVIGFGGIGRFHARILSKLEDVDFAGIVDHSAGARADAQSLGYRVFASIAELLKCKVDGVVLSVPTSHHHALALELLESGVALMIEKPIASTLEQGIEIIERANHFGLPLMIGYVERFNPAVIAAQRLLDDGLVGDPLHVATRRVGGMPIRVTDANVIVDIGVHDIDIISFLLSKTPKLISAQGGMSAIENRIDYASLALDAGGVVAHATMNWVTPVKVRDLIITGTSGYLQVDYLRQQTHFAPGRNFVVTESYEAVLRQYEEGVPIEMPVERQEPLRLELERFAGVLAGKMAPPSPEISLVSLGIALEATQMIERSLRAAAL